MLCTRCKHDLGELKEGWNDCPKCGLPIYLREGKTLKERLANFVKKRVPQLPLML